MYVLFVILRKLTFSTWCNVFIIIVLEVNVIKRDELADLETVNQGMVNWADQSKRGRLGVVGRLDWLEVECGPRNRVVQLD